MSFSLRSLLTGAALLAGVTSVAGAQAGLNPVSFGISAGGNLVQGDFGDVLETGYIVGGHLKLRPAVSPVGVRFDVNYASHEFKSSSADINVLSGFANLVYDFPTVGAPVRPYLLGGIGLGRLSTSGVDDSETEFGFQVGGGLEIPLSGITGFAEIAYQRFSTEGTALGQIPIRFGIRF